MKQRLTIFLVKNGIVEDDHLLDLELMKSAKPLNIPGTESVIYIQQPKQAKYPDWVNYIVNSQSEVMHEDFSKCQSESAVVVLRINGCIFFDDFWWWAS